MSPTSLLVISALVSQVEAPRTQQIAPSNEIIDRQNNVRFENTWSATIRYDALKRVAPDAGVIGDREAFIDLWQSWRPSEKPPQIDFDKSIVLVGTIDGPNRMFAQVTNEGRGNLRTTFGGTRIGGPGFGYILVQLPREGIRTVNGQPIAREPNNAAPPREPIPPQPPVRLNEVVRIAIQGRLQTGIGGETTGTVIQANGISFELAFDEPVLRRQIERLADRPVFVTGTLTAKEGIETGRRLIVEVDWIEAANDH